MTTDAILRNDRGAGGFDSNNLGFQAKGEHKGMAQTILRLEGIMAKKGDVRNMTIVAPGRAIMAAALPGGVLGGHDVAVHAGDRIVGQIRGRPREMKDQRTQTGHKRRQQQHRQTPGGRRPNLFQSTSKERVMQK